MNNILILSGKVARDLIQKDFKLVDIREDRKVPIKTVFYFEPTEELKKYLDKEHNIFIR